MGVSNPYQQGYEGYSPSDVVIDDHLAEHTSTTSYVKVAEFEILSMLSKSTELRFKADLDCWTGQTVWVNWRRNGSTWFTWSQDVAGYTTHSADVGCDWVKGDLVSVWLKAVDWNGKVKNIKICGEKMPLIEV